MNSIINKLVKNSNIPDETELGIWCRDLSGKDWLVNNTDAMNLLISMLLIQPEWYNQPLNKIYSQFLVPIIKRKIVFFFDLKTSQQPLAFITWAMISEDKGVLQRLAHNELGDKDWECGNELWITQFIQSSPSRKLNSIVKDLCRSVFCDFESAKFFVRSKIPLSKAHREYRNIYFKCIDVRICKTKEKTKTSPSKMTPLFNQDLKSSFQILCNFKDITPHTKIIIMGSEALDFALFLLSTKQCDVTLCDPDALKLIQAAEIVAKHGLGRSKFNLVHSKFDHIKIKANNFDLVYTFEILFNSINITKIITEMTRVGKDDAEYVLFESIDHINLKADKGKQHDIDLKIKDFFSKAIDYDSVSTQNSITSEQLNHLSNQFHKNPNSYLKERNKTQISSKYLPRPNLTSFLIHGQKFKIKKQGGKQKIQPKQKTTLIAFSGGIDSTYLLWKLLCETDDVILAHHIKIKNMEDRDRIETKQARSIAKYLEQNCRSFVYSESSVNHTNLSWYGYDVMTIAFEIGIRATSWLIDSNEAVDRWTMASCLEEGGWPNRWKHVERCITSSCFPHKPPSFYSLQPIKKIEQIKAMPDTLSELTWYCRHPKPTRSGYKTCGKCKTCCLMQNLQT